MSSTGGVSVPRIPITKIFPENINKFFAVLGNSRYNAIRKIRARIYYEDGTTEDIDNYGWNSGPNYFEWTIIRSTAFEKKVTKLEIYGDGRISGSNLLLVFEGDVNNPVFLPNDQMSFKIRITTTYNIQSQ